MEDNDIYSVKKDRPIKIEDNPTFQRYARNLIKDIPIDDLRIVLQLFLNKASVNIGYALKEDVIESVMEFIVDFGFIPLYFIGSGIIKGSIGKLTDEKRFNPKTIYSWLNETSKEYLKLQEHRLQKEKDFSNTDAMDLMKYPAGKAINKKIDWLNSGLITNDDYDNISLQDLALRIGRGEFVRIEDYGIKH